MATWISSIISIFLPQHCLSCQCITSKALCPDCHDQINITAQPYPQIPHLDDCHFLLDYDGPVKKMLQQLKFESARPIAQEIAKLIQPYCHTRGFDDVDMIVPVPSHASRQKSRGFNPVEEIGKYCFPKEKWQTQLIQRHHATRSLYTLSRKEREKELHNVFQIKNQAAITESTNVQGQHILIFDDIITTGTTLSQMGQVLKENGAKKVSGLGLSSGR